MKIQISTKNTTIPINIKGVGFHFQSDTKYTNACLQFENEAAANDVFNTLQSIGVQCYKTGGNAPIGATVSIYSIDKNSLQLQI